MTTETLAPAVDTTAPAPETAPASKNALSLTALILSIVSIPTGMAPLAIVGLVLGFIGRRDEPTARTLSTWAIITGFVSLFGWIILGFAALMFALPFAFGAWLLGLGDVGGMGYGWF
jgi:uncharacterized membrane protein